eukprot:4353564-Pyramimonas_sp.AAC.1
MFCLGEGRGVTSDPWSLGAVTSPGKCEAKGKSPESSSGAAVPTAGADGASMRLCLRRFLFG